MKIGVVGYGTVGRAVARGFKLRGHSVFVDDPILKNKSYEASFLVRECALTFVCVQTSVRQDGSMDLSYLERALTDIEEGVSSSLGGRSSGSIIVIKSTVVPGTTLKFASRFPSLEFAVNPEFMRAKHALGDFLYPDRIVIGASDGRTAKRVAEAYRKWRCRILATDPTTAETVKLLSNCFLTLKVAYACEAAQICQVLGVKAEEVMDLVCMDPRIGKSHLDPTLGPIRLDSPCLPKDTSALVRALEGSGYDPRLLKAAYAIGVEDESVAKSARVSVRGRKREETSS